MNVSLVRKELDEIKRIIKAHYPDAIFRTSPGAEPSPRSLWLNVYSDLADPMDLSDLVVGREVDLLERKKFLLVVLPHRLAYLPPRNGKARPAVSYPRPRAAAQGRVVREREATYQAKSKKRGKR
jgi:hypothetical protein